MEVETNTQKRNKYIEEEANKSSCLETEKEISIDVNKYKYR